MQETQATSGGQVKLGPGTLYGNIQRLTEQHLIEESTQRPIAKADDERRRYYRLTSIGRKVIKAEVARLDNLVQAARSKSLIPSPNPV